MKAQLVNQVLKEKMDPLVQKVTQELREQG